MPRVDELIAQLTPDVHAKLEAARAAKNVAGPPRVRPLWLR